MPVKAKPKQKRAILKAVYEDNLGLRPRFGRYRRAGGPHRKSWGALVAVAALLPFAAFGVYRLNSDGQSLPPYQADATGLRPATLLSAQDFMRAVTSTRVSELHEEERQARAAIEGMLSEINIKAKNPDEYLEWVADEQMSIAEVFGLGVRTIVIDPGHGGRDPGASGPTGLREKDVTLDVARRLRDRLADITSYRILLTREDDRKVTLKERVRFANEQGADLFISLHVNYLPMEEHRVIETYYFGPQSDTEALRLAEMENRDSEYSMGDFRTTIEKIGNTFKYQESRHLATLIQKSLYGNIRRENLSMLSSGIKTAPFVVLLGVDMPSVLTEISTLSNRDEEKQLSTDAYRDRIARYLEQGIVEYLGSTPRNTGPILGANQNGVEKEDEVATEEG